jgi:uncharacterized membrane protein YozB (DUF420 family)
MGFLISKLTPVLDFIRVNFYQIIAALVTGFITFLVLYLTVSSLKKMKSEIFSYYPFGRFFPQSGRWSVLYFLVMVVFLGGLIYFLAKGGFFLGPA